MLGKGRKEGEEGEEELHREHREEGTEGFSFSDSFDEFWSAGLAAVVVVSAREIEVGRGWNTSLP